MNGYKNQFIMSDRFPILVTGAHRSGTTWVGKMLAASGRYAYVSEPLNRLHRPGVFLAPVDHWYTYISFDNETLFLQAFQDTLQLKYHLWDEVKSLRSLKDAGRMFRDCGRFNLGKLWNKQPLLKDPFAVFSAEWFAGRLGCRVVITVRHPASFVSSLKRYDWSFNFTDFLSQPLLMRDWLEPFSQEMETVQNQPHDALVKASLLWRMIYHVVWQYRQRELPCHILRHEDLSAEPVEGFMGLYKSLGIPFNPKVEARILKATSSENPTEVSKRSIHSVNLDSRANIKIWQKRLTDKEIIRIREYTADVADLYYTDQDWA